METRKSPKARFLAAATALQEAANRLYRILDADQRLSMDELAHAALAGVVLALAHGDLTPEELAKLDHRKPLHGERAETIIGDALCDLAALARCRGFDEEALFAKRSLYHDAFSAKRSGPARERNGRRRKGPSGRR